MPAKQTIEFQIEWQGKQRGQLHFLIDNGKVVASDTDAITGAGGINVKYTVPFAPLHHLEWSLWFPGKTFSKLVAEAAVDGGTFIEIGTKDEAKNRWTDEGDLVGGGQ